MRIVREVLQTLALALVVYAAIQLTVQTNKVYGSSMEPNLYTGQYILVNKLVYTRLGNRYIFHPPARGDVVILRPPAQDKLLIKRVIGLPGETVAVGNGKVYINGEPLTEPYIKVPPQYTFAQHLIGDGLYFVLGDNRNFSLDSADWEHIGPIPAGNIVGQAWLSFWPPDRVGKVPNFAYAR